MSVPAVLADLTQALECVLGKLDPATPPALFPVWDGLSKFAQALLELTL